MIGGNEKNVGLFGHIEEKLSEPAALALSNQRSGNPHQAYSCLKASIGSRSEAFLAG